MDTILHTSHAQHHESIIVLGSMRYITKEGTKDSSTRFMGCTAKTKHFRDIPFQMTSFKLIRGNFQKIQLYFIIETSYSSF